VKPRMRLVAIVGLLLYGVANLFAGSFDLATARRLPLGVDVGLLVTGALLLWAAALGLRRSRSAFLVAVTALVAAFALAVFNERVLGLGHPSHHLVRGAYTVLVLWAAYRGSSSTRSGVRNPL